jgi:CelD/BcsL family acetyltransferase involved in cellulose biosynthesis
VIETVEDRERFHALRSEWNELLEASSSNCFFLTWEWLFTWWKHLSGQRRLSILIVRSGGQMIALAPLVVRPSGVKPLRMFRALEFLGAGAVGSDYLDLILRRGKEDEALDALADHLAAEKLTLELGQLGKNSSALKLAQNLSERNGWRFFELATNVCPYVRLSGHTWPSYLAALGASHRQNFHRRLKQLQKEFAVRLDRAISEEERREALAVLIDLHGKRWREKRASEAFSTADFRSFHEEISGLALERNWLRLFVLRLNGKPAASLYGFTYGRTFYFFQSGFDPDYARHSIGLVTMGLAIKSAVEDGVEEYDMLHGDESYKFLWASEAREIERLEIYPPSAAGLLSQRVAGLGRIARKAARAILPKTLAFRIATARRQAGLKDYHAAQTR